MENDFKNTFKDFKPKHKPLLDGFSRDFLIKAYERNNGAWHEVVFCASTICRLRDEDGKTSAIILSSGKEIPVRLSFAELKKNIFSPDTVPGEELDLTLVTKPAETVYDGVLEIGHMMEDGTIYAGISPDTKRPMYAAPTNASMLMDFNTAANYAKDLEIGGKKDFRVPSIKELNVLFNNKDKGTLKGTFNLTGSDSNGWYWSSSRIYGFNDTYAKIQRLSDGYQSNDTKTLGFSVRLVRG